MVKLLRSSLLVALMSAFLAPINSFAQNVGISGVAITPDPEALLELRSTTKGVLLPRLDDTQRATLQATPLGAGDKGLTIYNIDTDLYNYWDGSQWVEMQTVAAGSGAYIENQNASDQVANYRINGQGSVGTLGVGISSGLASRLHIHDASGTAGQSLLLVDDNASLPVLQVQDIGRVGIGIAAPATELHVVGDGRFSSLAGVGNRNLIVDANGTLVSGSADIGDITDIISGDGLIGGASSGAVTLDVVATNGLTANANDIELGGVLDQATTIEAGANNLNIDLNGTGNFRIMNGGTQHVRFEETGRLELLINDDANGVNGNGVIEIANGLQIDANEIITVGTSTLWLQLGNGGDLGIDNANTFYVDASANNIGMGTSAPQQKLHVAGGARVTSLSGVGTRPVYADVDGDFTNTAPTTGTLGHWTRTGTLLYANNTGDNVGIGTTSPTQKLHVEGNLRLGAAGIIDDDATSQGTSDDWLRLNGYIEMRSNTDNYGIVLRDKDASSYFGITARDGQCYLADANTYGNYFLRGNGANAYVRGDFYVHGDDVYGDNGSFRVNSEDNMHFSIDYNNNDADTRYFSFRKNDEENGSNDVELMRIQENGNVGIGATAPSRALEVYGATKEIEISNTSETDAGIIFNDAQATGSQYAEITFNSGTGNDLSFRNGSATPRMVIESNGEVGIGTVSPTYRLHVNGRLKTTGINETSDVRLKKDISPIENALSDVLKMEGVTYNWRTEEYPEHGLSEDLQHGLIAQELETIIPELVLTDKEGFKSIEYTHLVPVLIEALKEQNKIINGQEDRINGLTEKAEANTKLITDLMNQINGVSLNR